MGSRCVERFLRRLRFFPFELFIIFFIEVSAIAVNVFQAVSGNIALVSKATLADVELLRDLLSMPSGSLATARCNGWRLYGSVRLPLGTFLRKACFILSLTADNLRIINFP